MADEKLVTFMYKSNEEDGGTKVTVPLSQAKALGYKEKAPAKPAAKAPAKSSAKKS